MTDQHRYIDMEHAMCYNKDHWNALTDGRYKYIYYASDGREELFDLVGDPGETRNLANDAASGRTLKHWRNEMVGFFAERGEQFVRDGKLTLRKKNCSIRRFSHRKHKTVCCGGKKYYETNRPLM